MSDELRAGDLLDERYVVEATLDRGGFGVVYRARQRSTGQAVAIKLLRAARLRADALWRAQARGRFEREVALVARLRHPHVVRLIDAGHPDAGPPFIVFELLDGQPLGDHLLAHGPLPVADALAFMRQVASALAAAHAMGVVHRDIKPANIMTRVLDGRLHAMVLDFGVAGLLDAERQGLEPLTAADQLLGTPAYMAPEQIEGAVSPRADVYAWGLVFVECLTGRPVVRGESVEAILVQQLSRAPITLPPALDAHPRLRALLERALAKAPERRPADASALIAALDALPAAAAPPAARRRAVTWTLGAMAALAITLLTLLALDATPTPDPAPPNAAAPPPPAPPDPDPPDPAPPDPASTSFTVLGVRIPLAP